MRLLLCAIALLLSAAKANDIEEGREVSSSMDGTLLRESPHLTIKYWNGRGLMEVSRMILAIAGKYPKRDYEDGRYDSPPKGLKSNLGRMPVLTVDSSEIGQSVAIHFYLAAEHNLMGSNNLESARILSVVEHIREMGLAYRALVPYGQEPSSDVTAMWFNEGPQDVLGTADASRRGERYLTWWMGRIEQSLDTEGYAVGDKLSLADLYIYNAFREVLRQDELLDDSFPVWRREPFGDFEAVTKKLNQHPRIAASCAAVSRNENIQAWWSRRGKQLF